LPLEKLREPIAARALDASVLDSPDRWSVGASWRYLSLAVHSLSLPQHYLARARHFLSLLVVFAGKCRAYDRKRQVVTHLRQPVSVCDSLPEGKVEFCLTKLQAQRATSSTFAALRLFDVLNAFGLFACAK